MVAFKLDAPLDEIKRSLRTHYADSGLRFWGNKTLQPPFLATLAVFHAHHTEHNPHFMLWLKSRSRNTELESLLDDLCEDDVYREALHTMINCVHPERFENQADLIQFIRRVFLPLGQVYLLQKRAQSPQNNAQMDGLVTSAAMLYLAQNAPTLSFQNNAAFACDEMQRYNVGDNDLQQLNFDFAYKRLLEFNLQRARKLLNSGAPLGKNLGFLRGLGLRYRIERLARLIHLQSQDKHLGTPAKLPITDALKAIFYAITP